MSIKHASTPVISTVCRVSGGEGVLTPPNSFLFTFRFKITNQFQLIAQSCRPSGLL